MTYKPKEKNIKKLEVFLKKTKKDKLKKTEDGIIK
jgi:hypothetical protein